MAGLEDSFNHTFNRNLSFAKWMESAHREKLPRKKLPSQILREITLKTNQKRPFNPNPSSRSNFLFRHPYQFEESLRESTPTPASPESFSNIRRSSLMRSRFGSIAPLTICSAKTVFGSSKNSSASTLLGTNESMTPMIMVHNDHDISIHSFLKPCTLSVHFREVQQAG